MRNFDLHMHSCYSKDGQFTPDELIQIAKKKGLSLVALADHDCMKGIDEMIAAGEKENIQVIPAIEFSTLFNHGKECHLLGYGMDYKQDYFVNLMDEMQSLKDGVFATRVEKLENYYGIEIDLEQILKDAGDENPWFLMCQRIFSDPRYAHIEDFQDYIPGGSRSDPAPVNFYWDKCLKGSPLYVHVEYPSFKETVDIIHAAGGIAVLAHPFNTFYQNDELLAQLLETGIDGIEAYSNYHEDHHNEFYAKFAKEHHLLITCGSDFHGKHKPSIQMGEYGFEDLAAKQVFIKEFLDKLNK